MGQEDVAAQVEAAVAPVLMWSHGAHGDLESCVTARAVLSIHSAAWAKPGVEGNHFQYPVGHCYLSGIS